MRIALFTILLIFSSVLSFGQNLTIEETLDYINELFAKYPPDSESHQYIEIDTDHNIAIHNFKVRIIKEKRKIDTIADYNSLKKMQHI